MRLSDHSEIGQSPELHKNHFSSDILRLIRTALLGLMLSGGCATTTMPSSPSAVTPVQNSEKSNSDDDDKNDEDDIYGEDFPCGLKNPDYKGACPLVEKVDKKVKSKMVATDEKGAGHIF